MPSQPSHEVLKAAVDKAGVKAVAARLGLSSAMVYKWCAEPGGSGTPNPLDRLADLIDLAKDPAPAVWLCEKSGGYFVANPDPKKLADPLAVLAQTQKMVREFSDLLDVIAQSMGDGKVDPAEARRIRTEWEELKRHAEGFVRACEPQARARTVEPK
jgi:hypothetical protein